MSNNNNQPEPEPQPPVTDGEPITIILPAINL